MNTARLYQSGESGDRRPLGFTARIFQGIDLLTRGAFAISALLLGAITLIYCSEIVLRYVFQSPTVWAYDTVTYTLCAMMFLAAPEVARTNGHIAVTLLLERSEGRKRATFERILALATAIIVIGVAVITLQETLRLFDRGILTLGTIAIPKWWVSAFIPTGLLLVGLQYLGLALFPERRHTKPTEA